MLCCTVKSPMANDYVVYKFLDLNMDQIIWDSKIEIAHNDLNHRC